MIARAGDRDGRVASHDNARRYVRFPAALLLAQISIGHRCAVVSALAMPPIGGDHDGGGWLVRMPRPGDAGQSPTTRMPPPKLVAQISCGWYGLKNTRVGWRKT